MSPYSIHKYIQACMHTYILTLHYLTGHDITLYTLHRHYIQTHTYIYIYDFIVLLYLFKRKNKTVISRSPNLLITALHAPQSYHNICIYV